MWAANGAPAPRPSPRPPARPAGRRSRSWDGPARRGYRSENPHAPRTPRPTARRGAARRARGLRRRPGARRGSKASGSRGSAREPREGRRVSESASPRYLAACPMQTSRLRTALLVVIGAFLLPPATLSAQAVTGVGDDATTLKRGELRIGVGSSWKSWYERYGQGTPGRPHGSVEPLGIDFNFDTVGVAQFENLAPVQSSIRTLAGMPGFVASLGTSLVQARDNMLSTPLSLEMGITNRVSLSVMVPFVTATSNVNFVMNPTGFEPTLGFNPTLIAPAASAADASFLAQFDSASAQLSRSIALCANTPSATGCAPINANPAAARALMTSANSFASGLAQLYGGRNGSSGALFVPIAGTAAQTAIEAKVAAFRAMYAAYGAGAITAAGPVAAQAPLTATDMQTVFTDSLFGVNGKALATSVTHGLGNIEEIGRASCRERV